MGRKKLTEKDFLKGMAWFRAVSVQAGNASAYALEKRFDPLSFLQRDGKLQRSKKWDRYRDGKRLPTDLTSDDIVARVEGELPGTAKWLRSPLWAAIDGQVGNSYIIATLLRSLADVQGLLFSHQMRDGHSQWTRLPADETLLNGLLGIKSIDSLAAIILMAREAEVIASPELREYALHAYLEYQTVVRSMPELFDIADRVFWHIDTSVKHWAMVNLNRRLEVVVFSNSIKDASALHLSPHDC